MARVVFLNPCGPPTSKLLKCGARNESKTCELRLIKDLNLGYVLRGDHAFLFGKIGIEIVLDITFLVIGNDWWLHLSFHHICPVQLGKVFVGLQR